MNILLLHHGTQIATQNVLHHNNWKVQSFEMIYCFMLVEVNPHSRTDEELPAVSPTANINVSFSLDQQVLDVGFRAFQ